MKTTCVVLAGKVIHVGKWERFVLEPGEGEPIQVNNPLPEGAIEGEFDIERTADDRIVLVADYRALRAAEYPAIGDQLDALFKAGVFPADMAAAIQAVKDKYPKLLPA
jgi:hypothetical protein